MSITNTSKPTTAIVNLTKVLDYETWDTILTTWATETRAWDDTRSLIDNTTRPSVSITNLSKPV
jgi:hypothetical protein